MELLEHPKSIDDPEYDEIRDELWIYAHDDVSILPHIIKNIKNPEIRKMVSAIYNAGKELNVSTLDIGFHNLMYDPKTDEYKQIDYL